MKEGFKSLLVLKIPLAKVGDLSNGKHSVKRMSCFLLSSLEFELM